MFNIKEGDLWVELDFYGTVLQMSEELLDFYGYRDYSGRHFTYMSKLEDRNRIKMDSLLFREKGIKCYTEFRTNGKSDGILKIEGISFTGDELAPKFKVDLIDVSKFRELEPNHAEDGLTQFKTNVDFYNLLEIEDTEKNLPISIVYLDIAGLKEINKVSFSEGDLAISKVADEIMKLEVPGLMNFRMNGGTFSLLILNTTLAEAENIVEKIKLPLLLREDFELSSGCATKTEMWEDIFAISSDAYDRMVCRKTLLDVGPASTLSMLMNTLNQKTLETKNHCERISYLSGLIGSRLGMSDAEVSKLKLLGMVHDIGKLNVPEEILNKKEPLTKEEWEILKTHPEKGVFIAGMFPELKNVVEGIRHHHERWDGEGYPYRLKGEAIPIESRIISVVDAYDAMSNNRVYRNKLAMDRVVNELKTNKGKQFQPEIVDVFFEVMEGL